MHHQMRVRQACMNLAQTVNREDLAIGFAGELVGSVRCPEGHGQRIDAGQPHKFGRFFRVGQELFA